MDNIKIPIHPKFETFFEFKGRYILFTGGRGSGKSYTTAMLILNLLRMNKYSRVLYARSTKTSAATSIIPELEDRIADLGAEKEFEVSQQKIRHLITGNELYFFGIQTGVGTNTAKLKSLAGFTTLVFEEAEEFVHEHLFNKIDDSLRLKGHHLRVMLIMNPASKTHWIYRRFFETKGVGEYFNGEVGNTLYVHTDFRDNKEHLDPATYQRWCDTEFENPEYYKYDLLGTWRERSEGTIYTNWEYGEFPTNEETIFGLDFGVVDPTALVEIFIDDEQKLIYAKEHVYQSSLLNKALAEKLNEVCNDKTIIADSAGKQNILELRQYNLQIRDAIKGNGSVIAGIRYIQNYKLIVDRNSKNLVHELNNYLWSNKNLKEEPIDAHNHALDALRYAVTYKLKPKHTGKYHIMVS